MYDFASVLAGVHAVTLCMNGEVHPAISYVGTRAICAHLTCDAYAPRSQTCSIAAVHTSVPCHQVSVTSSLIHSVAGQAMHEISASSMQ